MYNDHSSKQEKKNKDKSSDYNCDYNESDESFELSNKQKRKMRKNANCKSHKVKKNKNKKQNAMSKGTTNLIDTNWSNITVNRMNCEKQTPQTPPPTTTPSCDTIEMNINTNTNPCNSPNNENMLELELTNVSKCKDIKSDQMGSIDRNINEIDKIAINSTSCTGLCNQNDLLQEKRPNIEHADELYNESNTGITPQLQHQHLSIGNVNYKNKPMTSRHSPFNNYNNHTSTLTSLDVDTMDGNINVDNVMSEHVISSRNSNCMNSIKNSNSLNTNVNKMETGSQTKQCSVLPGLSMKEKENKRQLNSTQGKTSTTSFSNCNNNENSNFCNDSKNSLKKNAITLSSGIKRKLEKLDDDIHYNCNIDIDDEDEPNRKRRRISTSGSKIVANSGKSINLAHKEEIMSMLDLTSHSNSSDLIDTSNHNNNILNSGINNTITNFGIDKAKYNKPKVNDSQQRVLMPTDNNQDDTIVIEQLVNDGKVKPASANHDETHVKCICSNGDESLSTMRQSRVDNDNVCKQLWVFCHIRLKLCWLYKCMLLNIECTYISNYSSYIYAYNLIHLRKNTLQSSTIITLT